MGAVRGGYVGRRLPIKGANGFVDSPEGVLDGVDATRVCRRPREEERGRRLVDYRSLSRQELELAAHDERCG